MAKVKIELDLDWIGEDGDVDKYIKDEVIHTLQKKFTVKSEERLEEMMNKKLEEVASKVTGDFLTKIMSEKIENIQIPHKSDDWGSSVEMLSVSEFVGKRYEKFLRKKVLNERGEHESYERDAKYTIHEYFVKDLLGKELEKKVSKLISEARQNAENTVLKSLESNLQSQLSADIIKRLNIPQMLKGLQEKAVLFEGVQDDS